MPTLLLERVEHCYLQAESFFKRRFARPEVSFKLRGQKAGCAHLQDNKLRFNAQLYRENREDFLRQTVAHEVAHLLAFHLCGGGIRPHGSEWQAIMRRVFALSPERCHRYAVAQKTARRFAYRCGCEEGHAFSAQRHALVQKGRRYRCLRCGCPLEFSGGDSGLGVL